MSVTFIRGDITTLHVDAIVNAANNELRGGGGVDGAIHAAAGAEQLHAFCKTLGGCPTGEAKLSPGFNLPAKFIIHTVGPVWQGGSFHEKTLLTSCYIRSLELAQQNHCKTVAFPLISAGAYGYPYEDALQIAYDTCQRFLDETKADMEIFIVLYQRVRNYNANIRRHVDYSEFPDADAFQSVANYISEHYHFDAEEAAREETVFAKAKKTAPDFDSMEEAAMGSAPAMASAQSVTMEKRAASSMSMLRHWFDEDYQPAAKPPKPEDFPVEETFTQLVIRHMREKNLTSPNVYTHACIDRKLFSKIISNKYYQPTKNTAIKIALGLQLSSVETEKLLNAAGFALSRSKITDLIISFCIAHNQREVWQVNGYLEDYGLTAI
jgi:O-acetyl-ADP-ribose deacetylase (regulator of RNase III)